MQPNQYENIRLWKNSGLDKKGEIGVVDFLPSAHVTRGSCAWRILGVVANKPVELINGEF